MKIIDFKALLERAEALFRKTGARDQAQTLAHIRGALPSSDRPVSEATTAARQVVVTGVTEDVPPEEIADRLISANTDRERFENILAMLTAKSVTKERVIDVAAAYTGVSRPPWRSKAAAIDAITKFFEQRAYLSRKGEVSGSIRPS
jgi:hypothetical protein